MLAHTKIYNKENTYNNIFQYVHWNKFDSCLTLPSNNIDKKYLPVHYRNTYEKEEGKKTTGQK